MGARKNLCLILIGASLLLSGGTHAAPLSQNNPTAKYSSMFLSKVISDNREAERVIRDFLSGSVKKGGPETSLLDRMGVFTRELMKKGVCIKKIKFAFRKTLFSFFIVMEDDYDAQMYTLFLEYEYRARSGQCRLRDVYFSLVFEEKMKEMKKFFDYR